jgi:hypothetical protein
VTRASLPSTVSRNVIAHAHTSPTAERAAREQQRRRDGEHPRQQRDGVRVHAACSAHQRVTACAGRGHTHLVTRSVRPLYEASNVLRSISAAVSARAGSTNGGSRLRSFAT